MSTVAPRTLIAAMFKNAAATMLRKERRVMLVLIEGEGKKPVRVPGCVFVATANQTCSES